MKRGMFGIKEDEIGKTKKICAVPHFTLLKVYNRKVTFEALNKYIKEDKMPCPGNLSSSSEWKL